MLAAMWLTIVGAILIRYKNLRINKLAMILLYIILLLITVSRTLEVIYIKPPNNESLMVVVTGCIATYSKIALGCCQAYAMQQILTQIKITGAVDSVADRKELK